MNKTIIIGNIGQPGEVKHTQGGTALCTFTVCVNEKGKDGQTESKWFNCTGFGERFTGKLVDYLKKGTKVYLEGKYTPRMYQRTNDGTMALAHDFIVNQIELLGGGQQDQQQAQPAAQTYQQPAGNLSTGVVVGPGPQTNPQQNTTQFPWSGYPGSHGPTDDLPF